MLRAFGRCGWKRIAVIQVGRLALAVLVIEPFLLIGLRAFQMSKRLRLDGGTLTAGWELNFLQGETASARTEQADR
jgi:hypothetical protein